MSSIAPVPDEIHIAGGFSIDAVLHADGRAETERIGGNALWAIEGVLAGGEAPHAHAVLGQDFPEQAVDHLRRLGVDCVHIRRGEGRWGVRVTYSYDAEGGRVQPADQRRVAVLDQDTRAQFIDTTRDPGVLLSALPAAADLPESAAGTSWHLGLLPVQRFIELTAELRARGVTYLQVDCPARSELRDRGLHVLGDALENIDVFLPSTSDTDVFLPDTRADEQITTFRRMGARIVILKRGDEGAIVATPDGEWLIPAYPEPHAVDPTGAGDVFAGAFLAALSADGDIVDSAVQASATASLSTQYRNPFDIAHLDRDERDRRAHVIRREVRKL